MVTNCPHCQGSRAEPGTDKSTCPSCRGTGTENMNTGPFLLRSVCRRCHGTGTIIRHPCRECEGKGRIVGRKRVNVSIPAGNCCIFFSLLWVFSIFAFLCVRIHKQSHLISRTNTFFTCHFQFFIDTIRMCY